MKNIIDDELVDIFYLEDTDLILSLIPQGVKLVSNNAIDEPDPFYALLELIEQRAKIIEEDLEPTPYEITRILKLLNVFYQCKEDSITNKQLVLIGMIFHIAGQFNLMVKALPIIKRDIKSHQNHKSGPIVRCQDKEDSLIVIKKVAIEFYGDPTNHNIKAGTFCDAIYEIMISLNNETYNAATIRQRLKPLNFFPEKSLKNGRGETISNKSLKRITKKHISV